MKIGIGPKECSIVRGLESVLHEGRAFFESVKIGVRCGRDDPWGQGLHQNGPRMEYFSGPSNIDHARSRPATGRYIDQPLFFEQHQRFAHRRSTGAEPLGQFHRVEISALRNMFLNNFSSYVHGNGNDNRGS